VSINHTNKCSFPIRVSAWLLVTLMLLLGACSNSKSSDNSRFSQETEIRVQESGLVLLTHGLNLEVVAGSEAKGVGFSLPLSTKLKNKDYPLTYKINYAMRNGASIPVIDQTKERYRIIYLGDFKQALPVGTQKFAFQAEFSGYPFAQEHHNEFSWFPIRNYKAGVSSSALTFLPPPSIHPKLGQYFVLVWPADRSDEPTQLEPVITDESVRFNLSQLPEGSHVQLIARWPRADALKDDKKPIKAPCAEFGENFKWNAEKGQCEKEG
jgi:hypothetical protein